MKFLQELVDEFAKLPGVGEKTALRFVLYYLNNKANIKLLAKKMIDLYDNVGICKKCNNITLNSDVCDVCKDETREKKICVVPQINQIISMEENGFYKGYYFVLPALINPLKGVFEEDIDIDKLVDMVMEYKIEEVVFLLDNSNESEITISYIIEYLPKNIVITKPANGLPVGVNLDFVDNMTLQTAFENRNKL